MQTIQLKVDDNYIDEVFSMLSNLKSMISEITVFKDTISDELDLKLFEEAKKDMSDAKSIDELLKEYEIEVES